MPTLNILTTIVVRCDFGRDHNAQASHAAPPEPMQPINTWSVPDPPMRTIRWRWAILPHELRGRFLTVSNQQVAH